MRMEKILAIGGHCEHPGLLKLAPVVCDNVVTSSLNFP